MAVRAGADHGTCRELLGGGDAAHAAGNAGDLSTPTTFRLQSSERAPMQVPLLASERPWKAPASRTFASRLASSTSRDVVWLDATAALCAASSLINRPHRVDSLHPAIWCTQPRSVSTDEARRGERVENRADPASSKIEKLFILGVRNFSNQKGETIAFDTPLTLIVGYNGSGKTTIIECLKYATTGELPPNSKTGGAFIHDPKLCGEKEVLAQVKLSFRATSGARMVASRNLQLTVKKASRSQKTLEGQLMIQKGGERTSVSTRVAELDQIIPQYLGVSKAILEYVIFCHQDDSLWPMSEPSVLKKRFDEIFEALKYTKVIENMKVLRKKQNEELGKLKLIEEHAKENKKRGDERQRKGQTLFDEIEALRTQVQDTEETMKEAHNKSREAYEHAARFEQIVAQLEGKRRALEINQDSVVDWEQNLRQMAESDEELQDMLDQYEDRVAHHAEEQEKLLGQYKDLKQQMIDNRDVLGIKQSEIGKHEAEKSQHDRQLMKRETLIQESAKRHSIRGYEYDIDDEKVASFRDTIEKMSRDQNKTLERTRQQTQQALKQAQEELNKLNERRASRLQNKEYSRSQMATNDKRISDLQRTMGAIKVDEGGEALLKDKKTATEQKLQSATAAASAERYDERVREAESVVRALEEQKDRLEEESHEATKAARETAQIDFAQKELKGVNHSLVTMKKVHGARISKLVDTEWEPSTLESSFQRVLSQKTNAVKEAEGRRDVSQTKLDNINFRLSNTEAELKKKRSELRKYEQAVKQVIEEPDDISTFEPFLQSLENDYTSISTDQAMWKANLQYAQQCIKTAEAHNACRLCKRSLAIKAPDFSPEKFMKDLEGMVARAQSNLSKDKDELYAQLEEVRNAKPSYEMVIRVRDEELPALRSDSSKLTTEREAVNAQLEQHDAEISELQAQQQEVESLSAEIQSIVGYHKLMCNYEATIRDCTAKQQSAGLSRGIDAVQADLKNMGEEVRTARANLTRLSSEKEKSRNLLNSLELEIRDINAELNSAQSKLKEKRALVDRIEELRSENTKQRDAIREHDAEIQDLIPQIEQAQIKYDDINRRGSEQVQRVQEDASKLAHTHRQLKEVEQEINAYIEKGGEQQLAETQQEIQKLQIEIDRVEKESNQVTRQVKKIEVTVREAENTKHAISENLRYRKTKRSIRALETEIEDLESHNAEKDKVRYEREGAKWGTEHTRLSTEVARLAGAMKMKDEQLKEISDEYALEYINSAAQYREAHIKVETTKAAVEDLGRYAGALDKAVMKYHSLKMEEINQIVEELWKQAYQGTDVDAIKIVSDNEAAKGSRTYNYRVVMVKDQVEMDMRGRCSAGQKVLASIVIRLALAECFGTNCGLIALDEPTTNLDTQNIEGLARSLSEIIKARRKQANFQLIVITHDETFLKHMNCADYCDKYWRVGRNSEQRSCIERQEIGQVA